MKQHKTIYQCRNNDWAQVNDPYRYSAHKAHCAVRDGKVVEVFPTKKAALEFVDAENRKG